MLLQNHTDAFAFYDSQTPRPFDGYVEAISGSPSEAHFFLAVCSLNPLAGLRNFLYVPAATNLLREREHHIELLNDELRTARAERDTMMRVYEEQNRHVEEQERELEARYRWAKELDEELKQKATDLKTVVDALDAAENTVIERTQWAQRLDAERLAYLQSLAHIRASRWMRLGRKLGLGPHIDDSEVNKAKTDENV